jgi:hypothetical protein
MDGIRAIHPYRQRLWLATSEGWHPGIGIKWRKVSLQERETLFHLPLPDNQPPALQGPHPGGLALWPNCCHVRLNCWRLPPLHIAGEEELNVKHMNIPQPLNESESGLPITPFHPARFHQIPDPRLASK